jgi:phosphatidylserine decarboxylase
MDDSIASDASAAIDKRARWARVGSKIGIAPEGIPIAAPILALGLIIALAGFVIAGVAILIAGTAVAAFFRDPERYTVAAEGAVVSGADGRVCDISPAALPGSSLPDGSYTRVSVFMSPLDVHVNRAPVSGEAAALTHSKGLFRAAFRDTASEHNERNQITIKDTGGREHAIVQIAGYLARRIICRVRPHQHLTRGERIGLIMFGSRVDHFYPRDYRITVQVGDRVRAGQTVIGESLK